MFEIILAATLLSLQYGIDPDVTLAIIETESSFKQYQVGSSGEIGLMQLRPKFHPRVTFEISRNIELGVSYLAKMKRLCEPTLGKAWVVCYNKGPSARFDKADAWKAKYFQKFSRHFQKRNVLYVKRR